MRGKPLWPRRLEVMLAQLAAVTAQVAGNKVNLTDFDLFAKRPEVEQAVPAAAGAQLIAAMGGEGGVRMLGSARRKLKELQSAKQPG